MHKQPAASQRAGRQHLTKQCSNRDLQTFAFLLISRTSLCVRSGAAMVQCDCRLLRILLPSIIITLLAEVALSTGNALWSRRVVLFDSSRSASVVLPPSRWINWRKHEWKCSSNGDVIMCVGHSATWYPSGTVWWIIVIKIIHIRHDGSKTLRIPSHRKQWIAKDFLQSCC